MVCCLGACFGFWFYCFLVVCFGALVWCFWLSSPTNLQCLHTFYDDLGLPPTWRPHSWKKKSLASKFPQESSRFVGAIVSLSHSLSIECLSYLYVTCMAHPGDLILPCGRKEGVRMRLSIRLPGLVFFIRRIAPRKTGMEYVSRGHC